MAERREVNREDRYNPLTGKGDNILLLGGHGRMKKVSQNEMIMINTIELAVIAKSRRKKTEKRTRKTKSVVKGIEKSGSETTAKFCAQ